MKKEITASDFEQEYIDNCIEDPDSAIEYLKSRVRVLNKEKFNLMQTCIILCENEGHTPTIEEFEEFCDGSFADRLFEDGGSLCYTRLKEIT
jgi:hypothetical protein